MTDFKNLEDIFNDSDFEKLVSPLKPKEKKLQTVKLKNL